MKKGILLPLLIAMLILPAMAFAAPTNAPATSVWTVPTAAKKGEKVQLNAFVYNNLNKTVTISVLFATPDDEIATVILTLPAQTAKTATSEWVAPATETTVTASVIKAVDAGQKNVPELLGTIGVVTVGAPASAISIGNVAVGAQTWFGSVFAAIEPWRIKQASYFATLRDQKKKELGINAVKDVTNRFELQPNDIPAVPGQANKPATTSTTKTGFPIGNYITLMYATALAALMASATIFYITGILIILFLLRLFIRLFT